MHFLTAFAVTLLIAVLVSDLAERSILSTAVLFLVAGFVTGASGLGVLAYEATDPLVEILMMLTLFSVLYTDGMHVGLKDLRHAWYLPGRALILGMPLTFLLTAALAHWVAGLNWIDSFLVGAILSPTDPVFAAALVGRKEVPHALRQLLNVESGLNDGLALPVVIYLLAMAEHEKFHLAITTAEVVGGVALGLIIPWVCIRLEQSRYFSASVGYRPLNAFAIGLLVLGVCQSVEANVYLAAFAAGVAVATADPTLRQSFRQFGELVSELLKLAALLIFGAFIPLRYFFAVSVADFLFTAGALLLVRPIAMEIALIGSKLTWRERATAAWFGPKGFASIAYGVLVLKSGIPDAHHMFHLIALVIVGSIVLHSSTDVLIADTFARDAAAAEEG